MTGRQEYDRTKDRQRILDKYMINVNQNPHYEFRTQVLCSKTIKLKRLFREELSQVIEN